MPSGVHFYENSDQTFAFLNGLFAYRQDFVKRMELYQFDDRSVTIKSLAEFHGHRKHFEDPISGKAKHVNPGNDLKACKRDTGFELSMFAEKGRIETVISRADNTQVKEKARIFKNIEN